MTRSRAGRTTKYSEPLSERLVVYVTPTQATELAAESNGDVSTWIREVALGERPHPSAVHPAMAGVDSFRAKFLTKAPCGDWKEAVEHAGDYVLSRDVAATLEAREGDVVVQTEGDSMEGARIFDGDLLLMRPLQEGRRPARGEITLVQVFHRDGACEAMIKRWMKSEPVQLEDGAGKSIALPKNIQRIKPVAVARGMIARLI